VIEGINGLICSAKTFAFCKGVVTLNLTTMKNFLIILIMLFAFKVYPQEILKIEFEEERFVLDTNSAGYTEIMKTLNDTVVIFGVKYAIKFPSNFVATDTGYFSIYYTGNPHVELDRSILGLIADYKSDVQRVWLDMNGNLDFSDDGEPFTFSFFDTLVLKVFNPFDPNKYAANQLYRKDTVQKDYEFIEKHWGKPGFQKSGAYLEHSRFWFSNQRLNVKKADIVYQNNTYRIGLMDWNVDGAFNSKDDRIMVSLDSTLTVRPEKYFGGVSVTDSATIISIGNDFFELIEIDPTGSTATFKKTHVENYNVLMVGKQLPNFELKLMNDSLIEIYDMLEQGYVLLDAWGSWCGGCEYAMPFLVELNKKYPSLQIMGLNYGDNQASASRFKKRHGATWQSGYLSKKLIESLGIDGYPTYFLISPEGKVLSISHNHQEAYDKYTSQLKAED